MSYRPPWRLRETSSQELKQKVIDSLSQYVIIPTWKSSAHCMLPLYVGHGMISSGVLEVHDDTAGSPQQRQVW